MNFNVHEFIKRRYGGVKKGMEVKSPLCDRQHYRDLITGLRGAHGIRAKTRNEKILLQAAIGLAATEKQRLGLPGQDSGRSGEAQASPEGTGSELAGHQMGADRSNGVARDSSCKLDSQAAREAATTEEQAAREREETQETQETQEKAEENTNPYES